MALPPFGARALRTAVGRSGVVTVAALSLLLTGCGGDGDEAATAPPSASVSPSASTKPKASASPEDELAKLAVAGDVSEASVSPMFVGQVNGAKGVKAGRAACQPLAGMLGYELPGTPVATSHHGIEPKSVDGVNGALWLASYADRAGAVAALAEVRTAVSACRKGFTSRLGVVEEHFGSVQPFASPRLADETVAYHLDWMRSVREGPGDHRTCVALRADTVVAAVCGERNITMSMDPVLVDVARAQAERLAG
ncbi:hypothetical protein SRB5_65510 [Streptomyces sp. RB5]|uniref:PknH-like extracellular domain-containing protein n=1 Tax=Streptomyces smaragdinus TaxID=2585196 RepID=A0A7K0CSL9_9ACTN|nr:hypothetical protein [Streptomyces smaragdinus]MQY16353.1 hypothetical protein [Streptomyces smaragdinus]